MKEKPHKKVRVKRTRKETADHDDFDFLLSDIDRLIHSAGEYLMYLDNNHEACCLAAAENIASARHFLERAKRVIAIGRGETKRAMCHQASAELMYKMLQEIAVEQAKNEVQH